MIAPGVDHASDSAVQGDQPEEVGKPIEKSKRRKRRRRAKAKDASKDNKHVFCWPKQNRVPPPQRCPRLTNGELESVDAGGEEVVAANYGSDIAS